MGKVSRQLIELKNAMQSDGEADLTMLGGLPHETTEEVLSLVVDPVDADAAEGTEVPGPSHCTLCFNAL